MNNNVKGVWINSPLVVKQAIIIQANTTGESFWQELKDFWVAHESQILQIALSIISAAIAIILKDPSIIGVKTTLVAQQQQTLDNLNVILKKFPQAELDKFHSIINQ